MQSSWSSELQRLGLALCLFTVLGWMLGDAGAGLAVGLAGYAAWTLRHMRLLERWLQQGGVGDAPDSSGFWGVLFDAIDRLRRQRQGERDRWQAAYEHVQESFRALADAVVMIDPDGIIEWANPASQALLGLDPSRDPGTHLGNLLRDPVFIRYYEAGAYANPLALVSPVNERIMLEVQVTPFGEGSCLLFARDVTRLHQLEVMRKDFVANVSHELKTPLTVIAGYLENLSLTPLAEDPRWQKAFAQMNAQASRMRHLVDDLLLLSRLESLPRAGNAPVALAALIRGVASEVQLAFGGRAIAVQCAESVHLQASALELHSAITNLLVNACKYTPADKPVAIEAQQLADGRLAIAVRDAGPGIEAQHLPRLTERFYRVDDSRFSETGGTGLGLAIVKHVLMRHDAELHIESEPGRGSTFTCLFPASRVTP